MILFTPPIIPSLPARPRSRGSRRHLNWEERGPVRGDPTSQLGREGGPVRGDPTSQLGGEGTTQRRPDISTRRRGDQSERGPVSLQWIQKTSQLRGEGPVSLEKRKPVRLASRGIFHFSPAKVRFQIHQYKLKSFLLLLRFQISLAASYLT